MKQKGFTLVELMMVVTVSLLLAGTATVAVNRFLAREKINQTATELVSLLNSARSYATTGQSPNGFNLTYVQVTLTGAGVLAAFPANVGATGASYFSKDITGTSTHTTQIAVGGLQFAAGSGKLVNSSGTPLSTQGIGLSVTSDEITNSRQILINPFGAVTLLPGQ